MFPGEFIKRISTQKYIDQELLLKSLQEPSPVSISLNRGKWRRVPLGAQAVPWCTTGFYLQARPSFTLDPLFHSGCYYPREASGMFLEQIFMQVVRSAGSIRVLDLCAAPGGKSTQLSDLIGKDSLLISNEVIKSRSTVLAETITKWGKGNTIVTQNDPSAFRRLPGYFDVIMIDAPCSGEGMFRDRTAIDEWSTENTRLCEERQRRIVSDIWPSLKENGLLIYSTCTFNPGENEENIRWLVKQGQAECLRIGIAAFEGIEEIDHEGVFGYGFYPGKVRGEGFFISVIRKISKEEARPSRVQKKSELIPDKTDNALAERWMRTNPGKLMKKGEELISLACSMDEFIHLYRNLNVVKGGTLIATRKKNDFLPAHELALSQDIENASFPSAEISLREALLFMRRDNLALPGLEDGWNLLTFMGVNIGFVKNIGKRLNNYFPVEWRIRMDLPVPGKENIIEWTDELQ